MTVQLENRQRTKTDQEWQRDIDVALLRLRSAYGAHVAITPHPRWDDTLQITVTTSDGHTKTSQCKPWYSHVLSDLEMTLRGEQLITCGTPEPARIGQKTRPRQYTCGTAYPRRQMHTPQDGVWRCEACRAKHRAHEEALVARRRSG